MYTIMYLDNLLKFVTINLILRKLKTTSQQKKEGKERKKRKLRNNHTEVKLLILLKFVLTTYIDNTFKVLDD